MKDYELIEHTADFGIRVTGASLEDLFARSAAAVFDILAQRKAAFSSANPVVVKVTQSAGSLDELLVNWLNELLSLSAAKELIFTNFLITKITENYMEADLSGENAQLFNIKTEIKAATYHQLSVQKNTKLWQAEVIFDV